MDTTTNSSDHNQRKKQLELYRKYFISNSTSILIIILRDISFIVATIYGLDDRTIGFSILSGARHFSLLHTVQTGSGAHSASYAMNM
jgi:hypothetical protein